MKIRRLADRAAGAIVATAILTGGAAYAANGADDSPRAAAVAADDRGGVVVTAAPADDSRSATRIADDGPRRPHLRGLVDRGGRWRARDARHGRRQPGHDSG